MKFLASYFDSKSREVQEEMWISFVIGSTLKPRMFKVDFYFSFKYKVPQTSDSNYPRSFHSSSPADVHSSEMNLDNFWD